MTESEIKQCKSPEKAWEYFKNKAFSDGCPNDIDELVKRGFNESLNEAEKYARLLYVIGLVQAKASGTLK